MQAVVFASGSEGNACLFATGNTRILVDAGIGLRALQDKLLAVDLPGTIDAIVITHAHKDHLGNYARLSRKLDAPVYLTEATARVTEQRNVPRVRIYGSREPFVIGDFTIEPTPLPHDAAQVALAFTDGKHRAVLATDLGEVPATLADAVANADLLLLESNHDAEMLAAGPYTRELKRRIAGSRGHLSNDQACELLRRLPVRTHTVVLMHLSRHNNRRDLALLQAREAVSPRVRLLAALPKDLLALNTELRGSPSEPPKDVRPSPSVQLPLFSYS